MRWQRGRFGGICERGLSAKIILDLCGGTGAWSAPYKTGYDVRLITLPEQDVRLFVPPLNVHGILAAPPCTEFSFAKHYHGKGNYKHDFAEGLSIVDACLRLVTICKPEWWVLENPRGYLRRWLGKPTLSFNPWQYGENYQKATDLWGQFTMPKPTHLKPAGQLKKFSMLLNHEIAPEYSHLSRTERRAITPARFAQAFFKANP